MVVDQPTVSVLGPLDIRISGRSLHLGGTKPRVPLADLPHSPLWDSRLRSLAEVRLGAAGELIDLRMARGRRAGAIGELRGLPAEHPFREDLAKRLMFAPHGSERQAEDPRPARSVNGDQNRIEPTSARSRVRW
jgi:DNA-binding SARP family transcriptional activator